MGKQSRLRANRKQKQTNPETVVKSGQLSVHSREKATPKQQAAMEYGAAFFRLMYGELEPITPALIAELSAKGIPAEDMHKFAKQGLMYSRKRNSFTDPNMEFE